VHAELPLLIWKMRLHLKEVCGMLPADTFTQTHTHTPMPSQFTPIRISVSVQGQITHFHAETYPLSCALPL